MSCRSEDSVPNFHFRFQRHRFCKKLAFITAKVSVAPVFTTPTNSKRSLVKIILSTLRKIFYQIFHHTVNISSSKTIIHFFITYYYPSSLEMYEIFKNIRTSKCGKINWFVHNTKIILKIWIIAFFVDKWHGKINLVLKYIPSKLSQLYLSLRRGKLTVR